MRRESLGERVSSLRLRRRLSRPSRRSRETARALRRRRAREKKIESHRPRRRETARARDVATRLINRFDSVATCPRSCVPRRVMTHQRVPHAVPRLGTSRHVASHRVASRRVASSPSRRRASDAEDGDVLRRSRQAGASRDRARARNRDRGTRFVDLAVNARLME